MSITKEDLEALVNKKSYGEIAVIFDTTKDKIRGLFKKYDLKQSDEFKTKMRLKSASLGGKALKGTIKLSSDPQIRSENLRNRKLATYYRNKDNNYYKYKFLRKKIVCLKYKGVFKCQECGYDKNVGNLSFHHRDKDDKKYKALTRIANIEELIKELDKCDVLCNNCHGEVHNQHTQNKNIEELIDMVGIDTLNFI